MAGGFVLDGMEDYLSEEDAVEVSAAMGSHDVVPTALQKAFDLVDDFAEMDELAMSRIDIGVNEHARRGLVPSALEDITPERVLHVPISEEDAATQAGALCESCSLAPDACCAAQITFCVRSQGQRRSCRGIAHSALVFRRSGAGWVAARSLLLLHHRCRLS